MRLYIKKRCRETLQVLMEAHGELQRLVEKKQTEAAFGLLEECQQGAISVGNTIEEAEGEGTEEVSRLETYCEQLWQLHEDLVAKKPISIKQAVKSLNGLLKEVSEGITKHLPDKREVVFLPYKASMWDSLESVWKKMDADSNVDAIVVPIPYYDKNPDGSFRTVHYELDQFPDDVPVIGYQEYDLEARHPEAIYIHNPYDEANYVTSVHPDFYSSKLKECTDELVYIPYFVLDDSIDPNHKGALDSIKHFCLTNGVINANRVIVQSENMKQAYVNILTNYFGENSRSIWEQKIEGTGSPKMERAANLTSKDYELPEEWKNIVFGPYGKRKVVFYNIGVATFLEQDRQMLAKIRRVLTFFKDHKDKVALLWRPHPLIKATLTSMRPYLCVEYEEIVKEYMDEAWGIYDDSPDLDRAIAISDAYYGDQSSVVWLYQQTGKPLMIQDISTL